MKVNILSVTDKTLVLKKKPNMYKMEYTKKRIKRMRQKKVIFKNIIPKPPKVADRPKFTDLRSSENPNTIIS